MMVVTSGTLDIIENIVMLWRYIKWSVLWKLEKKDSQMLGKGKIWEPEREILQFLLSASFSE